MDLLKNEFRRNIGGLDNLVSMCKSSNELFDFLRYFVTKVEATVQTVHRFLNIVNKYEAVIERTSE